ncbi:MAG: hypothetical protein FWC57_00690, partial [Endomicrobia bacterium]|nr:hypothetical protein [Endomicrobiia bacterium]
EAKIRSMLGNIDRSGSSRTARFFAVKSIYDENGSLTPEGKAATDQAKAMTDRGYPAFVVEMVTSRPAASRDVNMPDVVKMPTNAVFSVRGKDGVEINGVNEQYLTKREGALVIQVYTKRTQDVDDALKSETAKLSLEDFYRGGTVQFLSDLDNDRRQLQRRMNVNGSGMLDILDADEKLRPTEEESAKVRGVYITDSGIERQDGINSLNEWVRAAALLKTDEPENIATADISKMSRKLMENLFKTKREREGYNVLIVKAGDWIRVENGKVIIEPVFVNAMIAAAANGLRIVPEVNATDKNFEQIIREIFAQGFTGVSVEGSDNCDSMDQAAIEEYIGKVKMNLATLRSVSEQAVLDARNYFDFKNDDVRKAVGEETGALAIEVKDGKAKTTKETKAAQVKTGMQRVMKAREEGINVSAENISAVIDLLAPQEGKPAIDFDDLKNEEMGSAIDKIREIAQKAGLSAEMKKHIDVIADRAENALKSEDLDAATREIYNALGVFRGILRAQAEQVYMEVYNVDLETYSRNSRADRDAMGLLMSVIIASNKRLADAERFKEFLREHKKAFLLSEDADKTVAELKDRLGKEFINTLAADNSIMFRALSEDRKEDKDKLDNATANILILAASMAKTQGAMTARKTVVASRGLLKSMFTAA